MEIRRVCNVCGIEKPASELVASKAYRGGYMPCCKPCRNEYWRRHRNANPEARRAHIDAVRRSRLLRDYGINQATYLEMVVKHGDKCALCGAEEHGRGEKYRYWNVDHDHATGRVRGLLCNGCNTSVGHYEKLLERVGHDKVLDYLAG